MVEIASGSDASASEPAHLGQSFGGVVALVDKQKQNEISTTPQRAKGNPAKAAGGAV